MNIYSTNNQPSQNSVLIFHERYRYWVRAGIHIMLWLITIALASYTIPIATKGHNFATNKLILLTIVQTLLYYYVMGYIILPKYLYNFQPIKLLYWSSVAFLCIHISNYLAFDYLYHLSENDIADSNTYINRNWHRFQEAGIIGCFTNFRIFLSDIVYSTNVSLLYLIPKFSKDILSIRFQALQLEKDKLTLELNFLKSQVNPHFLFNTLNNVYADIFDTNEKAADLILRLSELMRYNLYETDLPKIALDKELAYIQIYLDLERNRLSDLPVSISYEQHGQIDNYQISPLLLITFVENAFKHGIKGATNPAYVKVNASLITGQLVFDVENSIPMKRFVSEKEKKAGGIGIDNVRRQLDILYKEQYKLTFHASDTLYKVTLKLQLESLTE